MTADPSETPVDEMLACAPDALVIPGDRLTIEESDAAVALYARAVGARVPTAAELDAERTARTTPAAPAPGARGRAEAARRFGTTP